MTATSQERRNRRSAATRFALIEAAESLFAEHGFAAVSTRQIGVAIGSGNNTVVAYHFGGKAQLIEAIYLHRLPAIDARREELYSEINLTGTDPGLRALLRALWLPLTEQVDGAGRHSYARFLWAMLREGMGRTRSAVTPAYPATGRLVGLASRYMPELPRAIAEVRWHLATSLVLAALHHLDTAFGEDIDEPTKSALFEDAIAMAQNALMAPVEAEPGTQSNG